MNKWNTVGPLPGSHNDEEIYIVWREYEDGIIEETVFACDTEYDCMPEDMRRYPPPVRVSMRVYSRSHADSISAERMRRMKVAPFQGRRTAKEYADSNS